MRPRARRSCLAVGPAAGVDLESGVQSGSNAPHPVSHSGPVIGAHDGFSAIREPTKHPKRRGSMTRFGVRLGTLLLAVATLSGCTGDDSRSSASTGARKMIRPTRTVEVSPPSVVRTKLRHAPTTCDDISIPLMRHSPYGTVVGRKPVWGGFYVNGRADDGILEAGDAPRTPHGWRIKVLWVMRRSQASRVRLHGANQETGHPVWFEPADQDAAPVATLDPTRPGAPSERRRWLNFPSYVYFPEAGCYEVQARSANGQWRMEFAFGA
jgi:hypothetical protein